MEEVKPASIGVGPSIWRKLALRLFHMEPGEGLRAVLAFTYLFLVVGAYLLIKTVRNALFISEFGAVKLPWVMLGIAVLAGGFTAIYIRLGRRYSTDALTLWTLLFFASNVVFFWWLAVEGHGWLYPVIYIWAGVFGVISTTQVWTIANELFTTREAKRLFGFIGAGGILGAIIGGGLAARLAPRIGTPNLMLIVAGMLLLAAGSVALLTRLHERPQAAHREDAQSHSLRKSLAQIGESPHLRLIAALVFVTALATTSVDFQFSLVAEQSIQTRDGLAAFFGAVYGTVSLVALGLQLVFTSRVMGKLGIGVSILLLPLVLFGGTILVLTTVSLAAAVILKGGDGILKHSLDRSSRELFYLPVASRVKRQVKPTIDTVMDRAGDGSAGVLQLLITTVAGAGLRASLSANLIIIVVWLAIAIRLRTQYVVLLRSALRRPRRTRDDVALMTTGDEAATRTTLEQFLRDGTPQEKLASLEWSARHSVTVDPALLRELSRNDASAEVRRSALGVLLAADDLELPPELLAQLESEGHDALISAIDLVTEAQGAEGERRLEALLDGAGEATRLSVVALMLRRLGPEFEPFAHRVFDALLAEEAPPDARCAATRALALLPAGSSLHQRLPELLADEHPRVRSAAAETAGRMRSEFVLPHLIEALGRPGSRLASRRALSAYGPLAVPLLVDVLADPDSPPSIRRQVPRVLAETPTSRALEELAAHATDADPVAADRCLQALVRIRRLRPDFRPIAAARVRGEIDRLLGDYVRVGEAAAALSGDLRTANVSVGNLLDAAQSERFRILERVFMLVGMEFPVDDVLRGWSALKHGRRIERANAVEFFDNLLPSSWKKPLLPLAEQAHSTTGLGNRKVALTKVQALQRLAEWSEPWVSASAIFAARDNRVNALNDVVRGLCASPHDLVRTEALAYLGDTSITFPAG